MDNFMGNRGHREKGVKDISGDAGEGRVRNSRYLRGGRAKCVAQRQYHRVTCGLNLAFQMFFNKREEAGCKGGWEAIGIPHGQVCPSKVWGGASEDPMQ